MTGTASGKGAYEAGREQTPPCSCGTPTDGPDDKHRSVRCAPRGWARPGDTLCDARLAEDVSCRLRATYRHKWHTDGQAEWTDPEPEAGAS